MVTSHGLAYNDATMVSFGDFTHQSGYLCMKSLLKTNSFIDGVFVANEQMAVSVLKALSKVNKKAPEDIRVIGYGNSFI